MNVYILTKNQFLFYGIKYALSEQIIANFFELTSCQINDFLDNVTIEKNDVFIIDTESENLTFETLIDLHRKDISVIMTASRNGWNTAGMLKFVIIPRKFYLSDLLQAIYVHQDKHHSISLPSITNREKSILIYTLKGLSIRTISNNLKIAQKTTYQHQRNALKKVGVKRVKDILQLPENFVMYLCHHSMENGLISRRHDDIPAFVAKNISRRLKSRC